MSNLNDKFVELQKDAIKAITPLYSGISSKDCSEENFVMTKLLMETLGLLGDLLKTIDKMEERQKETELLNNKLGKVILAKNDLDSSRYDLLLEEIRSIKKINNNRKEKKEE